MHDTRFLKGMLLVLSMCQMDACVLSDEGASAPVVDIEDEKRLGVSWEEYRDAAKAAGRDTGYYIAEWDLFFPDESALREHYEQEFLRTDPKLAVFQRLSTGFEPTYEGLDAVDIVYCVSNSFSNKDTVVADMVTATRAWQDVANVRFKYDPAEDGTCNQNNTDVDFAVMPTTMSGVGGCGANKLLWNPLGCPVGGSTARGVLLIQYAFFGSGSAGNITPVGGLLHELGHILGFRHEHPWVPGGCPAEPITVASGDVTGRQLTEYDQLSVMHYPGELLPSCGGPTGSDYAISALDGVGAREVYGIPAAWYVAVL